MSLKKLFQILLGIQFALGIGLAILAVALFWNEEQLSRSQRVHFQSFLLADELRQSSDDLTRLARTYVATGNEEYERQYWAVLDIRNGKIPRPVDYHRIYWDFVTETGQNPRPDGTAISLHELMTKEGFTDAEFEKLRLAQEYSDALVNTERIAMNAVKGLFDDGTGNFTVKKQPDRELAIKLMNNEAYHKNKARIMRPIDEFYAMFEERTAGDVGKHEWRSMMLLQGLGGIILVIMGMFGYSYVTVQRQITDRKKIEKDQKRLLTIIESTSDIVGYADAKDKHIIYLNKAGRKVCGIGSDEDVTKLKICDVHPEWTNIMFTEEILPAAMSDGIWTGECAFLNIRDRHEIPVWMVLGSNKATNGEAEAFFTVSRDITEHKRVEEELNQAYRAAENANRAKSAFLANMSHEIRTPMTAILGYAELMAEESTERTVQERIEVIQRNGKHLLGLINDILDLSKIEAEKLQIEPICCSPIKLVDEVVSLMKVRADAKHLKLEVDLACPLPETVLTDPLRLRQILVNLVGNAIKFTEHGAVRLAVRMVRGKGTVPDQPSVGARSEENRDSPQVVSPRLCFDVTDTGIGMSSEEIGKLFQPFTQADGSIARKFGGTGLGLCISKRLCEALGGNIEVHSEPGKGSTFSVTIDPGPLDGIRMIQNAQEGRQDSVDGWGRHSCLPRPGKNACPTVQATPEKIALHGRILLAEDGEDNQRIICFLLKKAGAEVVAVENGQLAVEQASAAWEQGNPFDVILMDMQMPVMFGDEATRQLRGRGYTGPIVALTANTMAEDCQKCLDAGCDDYLSKPFEHRALLEMAARHITAENSVSPAFAAVAETAALS